MFDFYKKCTYTEVKYEKKNEWKTRMTCASKQKSISYYFNARSFKNFELKNWKVAKNTLGTNFFTLWLLRNPICKVFMPNNACLSRRLPGRVPRPKPCNTDPALSYPYHNSQQTLVHYFDFTCKNTQSIVAIKALRATTLVSWCDEKTSQSSGSSQTINTCQQQITIYPKW